MPAKIDDKIILDDIMQVITKTSNSTHKNYKMLGKYPEATIRAHFGNWNNALELLNIVPKHKRSIDKQDIINDVLKVFEETGCTGRENYLQYGQFSRAPIKRLFGNWNNLLKELDIKVNMYKPGQYSKEDILIDYGELCVAHNKILTAVEYRKFGKYSQPIVDNMFGNFSFMKKEMGLKYDASVITNEELIEDLKALYDDFGFLTTGLIDEFALCSFATVLSRLGNMQDIHSILDMSYYTEENMSKFSKLVLKQASKVLGDNYIIEHTFEWLINPRTGRKLFLDIYYPELKLAIEADGTQHRKYNAWFHKSVEEFEYSQYRDRTKDRLLKEHGVTILRVPYSLKAKQIKNLIESNT